MDELERKTQWLAYLDRARIRKGKKKGLRIQGKFKKCSLRPNKAFFMCKERVRQKDIIALSRVLIS